MKDKIRTAREKNHLTQEELARKLGVTQSAVAQWEAGITTPKLPTLVSLAETLNVSIEYLIGKKVTA